MLTEEVNKTMNNEILVPLGFVSEGKKVRIVSISGGTRLRNRINHQKFFWSCYYCYWTDSFCFRKRDISENTYRI